MEEFIKALNKNGWGELKYGLYRKDDVVIEVFPVQRLIVLHADDCSGSARGHFASEPIADIFKRCVFHTKLNGLNKEFQSINELVEILESELGTL